MRNAVGVLDRIHAIGWRHDDKEQVVFVYESDRTIEIGEFARRGDPDFKDRPWCYTFELQPHDLIYIED
jgi:hypothetical protein